MRYRIAVTSAVAVLGLGVIGVVSGPGWNPVPMAESITVQTDDTAIGRTGGTDPVGTYDVASSVVTVELTGATVEARILEPIGAEGPRPGVVFVHGAGTGSYDVAFVEQARAMASAGIVTMVPNKRLDTYTTRSRDYVAMANDYLRSVDLLRGLPGVDPDRVGVYGESEGAWIVPVMAADNPAVAFTILVAAPVVPPRQQAAFACDSYLRATGVPVEVLRAIPRIVGMEFPGGGFAYIDFDAQAFQRRMRQPMFIAYGTGDAAMPTVQGAQRLIDDLGIAGNDDWTLRYYAGANHGLKIGEELAPGFARDLSGWVLGLPETAHAEPRIAGDQPYQRFRAGPVERPRWFAEGSLLFAGLGAGFAALLVGPVIAGVRRLRGRRERVLASGVRAPLVTMAAGSAVSLVGLAAYLLIVANLAQNYRTSTAIVQGGWFAVRAVAISSVVAAVVLMYRILDGRRRRVQAAARSAAGVWTLVTAGGGAVALILVLAYFAVFPTLG